MRVSHCSSVLDGITSIDLSVGAISNDRYFTSYLKSIISVSTVSQLSKASPSSIEPQGIASEATVLPSTNLNHVSKLVSAMPPKVCGIVLA